MCLDAVTTTKKEDLPKKGFGWKVFTSFSERGVYASLYYDRYKKLLPGKWYRSPRIGCIRTFDNVRYIPGFHLYKTRDAARRMSGYASYMVVKKVEFREVLALGRQDRQDVIVVRSFKILKEFRKVKKIIR